MLKFYHLRNLFKFIFLKMWILFCFVFLLLLSIHRVFFFFSSYHHTIDKYWLKLKWFEINLSNYSFHSHKIQKLFFLFWNLSDITCFERINLFIEVSAIFDVSVKYCFRNVQHHHHHYCTSINLVEMWLNHFTCNINSVCLCIMLLNWHTIILPM